jgi:glyoxylate reductase
MFTAALARIADLRVAGAAADDAVLEGAAVYLATGVDPVPRELIERFPPGLGLIANIATGTDNIDLEAAAARNIAVSNTPVVAEDTADLTMALLLAACRRLSFCESALRAGDWQRGAGALGSRVHGKVLGIVGLGAIGQAVARRAAGFDLTLLYHGPSRKPEAEAALGVQFRASLQELLAESDIVSLNCPLTPASRHLMNAQTLAQMKPGAVLVNTGRGPLVDEKALVAALHSGHLGAAGLDVFEFEPRITPELLNFDNVTLLPHIGSATGECRTDMAMRAFANIRQYLANGTAIDNCVGARTP